MSLPPEIVLHPLSEPVNKTICLPGSKSLTNRALLIAALARGTSTLDRVLLADDTWLMVRALQALGIDIRVDKERQTATVTGGGGYWPTGEAGINCGNAGTVMRFLTAACSVGVGDYRLDGSPRMRQRPIGDLVNALRNLGASIGYDAIDGYPPLTIHAHGLSGAEVILDRPISSQFVSALLMTTPRATGDVFLRVEGGLVSAPYVHMTLGVMRHFGVEAVQDRMNAFVIPAPQTYTATSFVVEPDATAASYFFAAAALTGGRITVDGLGRDSSQGDMGFLRILEQMGCRIEQDARATTVHGPSDGNLKGVAADLVNMPDVAQTLAVLAAFADGPTRIRNVGNLRVKETDRLCAISTELGHLGIETEVAADSIAIIPNQRPVAGIINTYDDHRMAMSFALAGLRLDGVVIRNPGCVSKTFPVFFTMWEDLRV